MFSRTERQYVIQVRGHDAAVSIGFSVPAPTSPASLGISDDTRLLGIALTRLRVGPWRLRHLAMRYSGMTDPTIHVVMTGTIAIDESVA